MKRRTILQDNGGGCQVNCPHCGVEYNSLAWADDLIIDTMLNATPFNSFEYDQEGYAINWWPERKTALEEPGHDCPEDLPTTFLCLSCQKIIGVGCYDNYEDDQVQFYLVACRTRTDLEYQEYVKSKIR